ncbi:MAG: outer membrane lipoprotein-sorting protein [Opitutaceae bacterium]
MTRRVIKAALSFLVASAAFSMCVAQPRLRPPASYVQPTPPSREEGAAILEQSRNIGLSGPYYLEFEIEVRPRRGDETRMAGRWFGTRTASGALTRFELAPGGDRNVVVIVHGGADPAAWKGGTGDSFEKLTGAALLENLEGTHASAADLQTPFMHWTDFVYEGLARFRGRPTHVFLLYPPDEDAERYPGVGGVRVFIDTAYEAISQAQWLDEAGNATKTITILDLKKISDRWIVKSFEIRDEKTRDKTRFVVTAAALDVDLPPEIFIAEGKAEAARIQIPDEKIVQVR